MYTCQALALCKPGGIPAWIAALPKTLLDGQHTLSVPPFRTCPRSTPALSRRSPCGPVLTLVGRGGISRLAQLTPARAHRAMSSQRRTRSQTRAAETPAEPAPVPKETPASPAAAITKRRKRRKRAEGARAASKKKKDMAPPRLHIVFGHGAGAGPDSAWMQAWAERLRTALGANVVTPDLFAGRRGVPRLNVAAELVRVECERAGDAKVVLVGKSFGSRAALAAVEEGVQALACVAFGYPIGNGGERRDMLRGCRVPLLVINGTKDSVSKFSDLREAADGCPGVILHVVEDGDHSLVVGKRALQKRGTSQEEVDDEVCQVVVQFVKDSIGCDDYRNIVFDFLSG